MNDAHDEDLFRLASLDDAQGPARPLSAAETDALVGRVLEATAIPPGGGGSGVTGGKVLIGLATIALLSGGGAWVAQSAMHAPRVDRPERPEPIPGSRAPEARTTRLSASESPSHASVPQAAEMPTQAAPAAPMPVDVPASSEPTRRAPRTPSAPAETESAVDLLAEANRLRRAGAYAQAEATYRRVVATSPGAREAHVARVAAAGLRLDRLGDAQGAARLYREAMRGRGALAAEATFGYARASRSLGDRAGEIEALRAIVERHPASPYVRPATERLRALGVVVPGREGE